MNILFLTILELNNIDEHSLYTDLLRTLRDKGHNVYSVSPYERRIAKNTDLVCEHGIHSLRVKIGNITKCNTIEKGISTLLVESQYKNAIKKYFSDVKFDLVLYSTPPITLVNVIKYVKQRDNATSYLMLKDIFPQNAVDLGMLSKKGMMGILYRFFRHKEKKLYSVSDHIGCMSKANCDYVINNNHDVDPDKVEICPNSIEVVDVSLTEKEKIAMRNKYGIPLNKKVFVYGGNLGKPQGIPFIIDCLKTQQNNEDVYFLIVGDGTEFHKLKAYFDEANPQNMKLMRRLPKDDYDRMIAACDVGMIFLDHRFTIPNFPSRLLSYMQAHLPVFACTDPNTDVGKIITEGGFGWWCESDDAAAFMDIMAKINADCIVEYGNRAFDYLKSNYTSEIAYKTIMEDIV